VREMPAHGCVGVDRVFRVTFEGFGRGAADALRVWETVRQGLSQEFLKRLVRPGIPLGSLAMFVCGPQGRRTSSWAAPSRLECLP